MKFKLMFCWLTLTLSSALGGAAYAADPLRYRFTTGDWFIYERRVTPEAGSAESNAAGGAADTRDLPQSAEQIEVWCLDVKREDALLLIDNVPAADRRDDLPRGVLLQLDPRGAPEIPPEMARSAAELEFLFDILPPLQSPFDEIDTWRTAAPPGRTQWRCKLVGPDKDAGGAMRIDFSADDVAGIIETSGLEKSGSFWFDPQRGVVTQFTAVEQSPNGRRLRTTLKLKHTVHNDAKWCALRVDEAAAFLRRARQQEQLLDSVLAGEISPSQAVAQNEHYWAEFIKDLHVRVQSPFQPLAEARQKRMRQAVADLQRLREFAERVRGKPAATWSLQDADGVTHASEEFRTGWTVECFWSGRNIASLRMLDTLRALALDVSRDIEDHPLQAPTMRIVGFNVDADPDFARRAIRRCGGKLTQMLAESLVIVDTPPELPYVRVIEPGGRVRAVFFGWRPSLSDAVRKAMP